MKNKKINGWDEAIAKANNAIIKLRSLIAICNQKKVRGEPFPGPGTWDKAIFDASCHVAQLEAAVSSYRTNKAAGSPWTGDVSAAVN